MTLRRIVPIVVLVGLPIAAVHGQAQFTVIATVLDPATGKPVETLAAQDVGVTEDGVSATILKVDPIIQSVKVEVLIDNGSGIGRNLVELRNGVRRLLEGLPADVETALVTTAPQPRFLVRATKDRDELLKGVDRIAPDSGSGRFVESLGEAAERANKSKDTFTIIIAAGTTSGDGNVRESDLKRALEQIRGKPMLVHVLLYAGEKSASGGVTQVEVGERAAQMTGGRYEFINTMNRYATLLTELGAEVAKQLAGSTRQFRITVQRPNGKKGDFGKVSIAVTSKVLGSIRLE